MEVEAAADEPAPCCCLEEDPARALAAAAAAAKAAADAEAPEEPPACGPGTFSGCLCWKMGCTATVGFFVIRLHRWQRRESAQTLRLDPLFSVCLSSQNTGLRATSAPRTCLHPR